MLLQFCAWRSLMCDDFEPALDLRIHADDLPANSFACRGRIEPLETFARFAPSARCLPQSAASISI